MLELQEEQKQIAKVVSLAAKQLRDIKETY